MRWDDDDSLFPAWDELPVMRLCPVNGRHGFILHDASCHFLQRAFQPGDIPLERLLEVCKSLPFPLRGNGVSWGHDYGGLHFCDNLNYYPGDDCLLEEFHNAKLLLYAKSNQYDVPEIPILLAKRLEHPIELPLNTQLNGCFSNLPCEILEAIAVKLPTNDALGLRCVSEAFLPLLSSATFWASRFQASDDRCFVFETRESQNKPVSTYWSY